MLQNIRQVKLILFRKPLLSGNHAQILCKAEDEVMNKIIPLLTLREFLVQITKDKYEEDN